MRLVVLAMLLVMAVVEGQANDVCSLPPETGLCKANFPSFYFNPSARDCEEFTYGGCGGNANRFATIEECRSACM
ncbi:kunitz-type serine protease inhibitor 2-like [Penaeus chinensis]|uniref:kunitz-type serine protease inhibitor 2-like n=1 Tax=Penaeus chinensis TaxID=139456 RepID=UPI001FB73AC0|nr:kunitz-type serine protease inhibitor 2-like [Penaeus chinensis]